MLLQHGGTPLVNLMREKSTSGIVGGGDSISGFQQSLVIRLALQIGSAVSYMHHQDPPIAHRDIKAENIMEARGVFRLVDFGSASTHAYEPRSQNEFLRVQAEISSQTTLAYRAPEMCDVYRKHRIDQKVDVWALGILLYYVMYFQFPFEETNLAILNGNNNLKFPPASSATGGEQHMNSINNVNKSSAPIFHNFDESLIECVKKCLTQNPAERWSVDEMIIFLVDAFPEEGNIVREIMDGMKDEENPNLIKSNWLTAGGLTPSGKQKIQQELEKDEHAVHLHSLVCPGEMGMQELSPLCSGKNADNNNTATSGEEQQPSWMRVQENSSSQQASSSSSTTTGKSGGLFGKLKWNNNNSNQGTTSGGNNNLPPVESGTGFLFSDNNNNIPKNQHQQQRSGAVEKDLFGLPVAQPTTSNTITNTVNAPPAKPKDPFASLF
jgi:serine/threonine protein kinase